MTTYRDFEIFGGVREFVNYRGPEAIVHGPAETGKTMGALYKLHICADNYPNASIVIARKTLSSTYSTVLQMFQDKVLGKPPWPCEPYGGAKPEWFDYPNGSRIWITGLDKSSKVLSAEHDILFVNQTEELSLDDWETLTTRTTGRAGNMPYSQTLGDANPAYPAHWMYRRKSLRMFYSKHDENPLLYDQATGEITEQGIKTMRVLEALTGVRKKRLRYGKAAQAEGAIYEWDESIHLIYENEAPERYAFYVAGQDWGYSNPGCFGVWGVDGDGRMYLVVQIYRRGEMSDWWTARAVELQEEFGHFVAVVCDPSEPEFIAKFRAAGLNAIAGHNRVRPGIDAVSTRLAVQNDGRARLFIVRDCGRYVDEELERDEQSYRTEDEFPAYVWADRRNKEEPVKEDDHGLDMARYVVMYLDGEKRPPPAGTRVEGLQLHKQRERPSRWRRGSR